MTRLAGAMGKGLMAGLVGTVAMTISSTIEQKVRGREPSTAPADAAARLLGIERFESDAAQQRFGTLVHWGYGTAWGMARGLMRFIGLPPAVATAGHFTAVWGSSLLVLPSLEVSPPITDWKGEDIAVDLWHHIVYVVTAGLAYELIDRRG